MRISLPWWLNPWREVRAYRIDAAAYEQRIDSLCEAADQDIETITHLEDALRDARGEKT